MTMKAKHFLQSLLFFLFFGGSMVRADFRVDFDGVTVDTNKWNIYQPFSQSQVTVGGGWVSFVSRGGLIAKEIFPAAVQISGRFRNLSSQDAFKVVLRSDLSTFEGFGEKTGVVVVFYQNALVIADSGISGVFAQKLGLDLSGETEFRISDDSSKIAVFLNGSAVPLLEAITTRRTGDKAIFYNREISGTRLDIDFLEFSTTLGVPPKSSTDSDGDGLPDDYEIGYSRYKLLPQANSWKEAVDEANAIGAHLLTITSKEEWDFVAALFAKEIAGKHVWLGATDEIEHGKWKWVTGEPFTYAQWGPNSPDNRGGNQHYLIMWYDRSGWDDIDNVISDPQNFVAIAESGFPTDPNKADTDGDGLSDGEEVNVYHTFPNFADSDQDGLSDGVEIRQFHTDPLNPDTDGDGLTDGQEVTIYGTNPLVADTDGDGLSDGAEVKLGTNPTKADSDGDGFSDKVEILAGKNALDPNSKPGAELHIVPAVQIQFASENGKRYQIQISTDLKNWDNVETPITGNGGNIEKFFVAKSGNASFYRAEMVP